MDYRNTHAIMLYLLKYLDDDIVALLLKFIYEKKQFYNPYSTYKELLLCLIDMNDGYTYLINKQKFDINTVRKDKEDYAINKQTKNNSYIQLKDIFRKKGYIIYKNKMYSYPLEDFKQINNENLEYMVELFNNLFLDKYFITDDTNNGICRCLVQLRNSLSTFTPSIHGYSNKKKFFNTLINKYIEDGKCYNIYPVDSHKKLYDLIVTTYEPLYGQGDFVENHYQIIEKNNKLYLTQYHTNYNGSKICQEIKNYTTVENNYNENSHALVGAKTIPSFFNSIKSIDNSIIKLQEQIEQEDCHICNPISKNTKYHKKHMCKKCQKLINLIIEDVKNAKSFINQADIVYAIKKKGKDEKKCQNIDEIKQLRYKNLTDFLTKLNSEKRIINKNEIESLVNLIFKDISNFKEFIFL